MRFNLDERGDWVVHPADLASKLGMTPESLQHQMRLGLVTSRIERGSDEDEGRSRVTVRTGRASWEGIFDVAGSLISERTS